MTHTFYLKEPKSIKKTLIYFSCSFKSEGKKFVYSTGEKIFPKHWSKVNNQPVSKGKSKDINSSIIKSQLNRYTNIFEKTVGFCKMTNKDFSSLILRDEFDKEFKKVSTKKDLFFDAYDLFSEEKILRKEWKPSTVKRYKNIKNHLEKFELKKRYKLTFGKINNEFYTKFLDYCYEDLSHYSNTLARNVGLFKTFMFWALEKGYTYNDAFKSFEKPKTAITEEIALTFEQVEEVFNLEIEDKKLQKVRDVFVFLCLTGMRFGEMRLINQNIVSDNAIQLKEEKDGRKESREIPLFSISKSILVKYDYSLPLISNQKLNEYIKDVFEFAGYINNTEFTRLQGVESTRFIMPFYKRIATHTGRRTFITIMRNKGIADKTIMSITGHKDIKTFNMYHKVDDKARFNAVNDVFGSMKAIRVEEIEQ